MNPLYPMNDTNLINQFQRFKSSFRGDPQKAVQELMNSGRITQQQYDNAVQKAQALQKLLGR